MAIGYLVVSLPLGARREGATSPPPDPVPPPFIMFRVLSPRQSHGHVAVMGLAPDAELRISKLSCLRLHYAGRRGLCVTQEPASNSVVHVAYVFDEQFEPGKRLVLDGVPTRVRVAPNGRVGTITTYGEEESAQGERLATRTRIIDLHSGRSLADLREFRIDNPARPLVTSVVDFASVAFERDSDRFFATLATDAERYLVSGSINERRLSVIRTGVTNEAISPDGRRLVVKRLLPERGFWQLAVIDLSTWSEHDLRQGPRSVDDQVEWLDDEHVVYHDVDGETTSLWMLPADGINGPRVLIKDAYSAAVQR
jgi:hypothetical protein